MRTRIPPGSCVVLVGPSSAGKTTWAGDVTRRTTLSDGLVLEASALRAQLFGDPNHRGDGDRLSDLLERMLDVRLGQRRTTIVDATNLLKSEREPIVRVAARHGAPLFAVRFDVDVPTLAERNARRPNPRDGKTISRHVARFENESTVADLDKRGFTVLAPEQPLLWLSDTHDGTDLSGPFAIVGDIHGDVDALEKVDAAITERHGDLLRVYVGDIGHKGPESARAYEIVCDQIDAGEALTVKSNHGNSDASKIGALLDQGMYVSDIAQVLRDKADRNPNARMVANVADLVEQLARRRDGEELARRIVRHQTGAPSHLLLHGGDLVVAHGGMQADLIGRTDGDAEKVMVYGTPVGPPDEDGKPQQRDSWVADYLAAGRRRRLPQVVYGHITYEQVYDTGLTVGIDTGAGAGGRLTAAIWDGGIVDLVSS